MGKKPHTVEDSHPVTVSELCAAVQGARVVLMVQDGGDIFQHLDDGRILMFTVVGHGSLAFELASLETLQ